MKQGRVGRMLLLVAITVLGGCASDPGYRDYPSTGVVIWQPGGASLPGDLSTQIAEVYGRLLEVSGVHARFAISGSHIPNAYALSDAQGPAVHLNAGMIDILGYDLDAVAFVLAHELSHIQSGHLSDRGRERARQQDGAAQLLGTVADLIVPFSALVVEAGNEMLKAGYSRDQEREADERGLALMAAAGYDPEGAIRFQRRMLRVADPGMVFFATHPQGEERIERLQAIIDAHEKAAR